MVVIKHHPLIQRKGDRMVHVACHFEATNRTISNTYSVLVEYVSFSCFFLSPIIMIYDDVEF